MKSNHTFDDRFSLARLMRSSRIIHVLFDVGVIAKGVDGVLETVGGVLLFFVSPTQIHSVVAVLTQHELSEDPRDLVANYLLNSTRDLSTGATVFAATYLLWHGIVKIGLVVALLLRRRWAYPWAIVAFALFLVYQLYRFSHTHAAELLVLSVVDVFVIGLTWLEYKRLETIHGFTRRSP
jgi:uncharacterized membrane protein